MEIVGDHEEQQRTSITDIPLFGSREFRVIRLFLRPLLVWRPRSAGFLELNVNAIAVNINHWDFTNYWLAHMAKYESTSVPRVRNMMFVTVIFQRALCSDWCTKEQLVFSNVANSVSFPKNPNIAPKNLKIPYFSPKNPKIFFISFQVP